MNDLHQSSPLASLARRLRWLLPTPGNVVFTLLVVGVLFWASAAGAFPLGAPLAAGTSTGTIAYQGRLADAGGTPLTGTYSMIFRLYNVASGGSPLWSETWTGPNSVAVSDGLFNVMLGSLTPIPQNVITGSNTLWLGITVAADNEMAPRIQLGSVPFAVQALTVPDGSITAAKLAPDVNVGLEQFASVQLSEFSTTSTAFVDIPESAITVTVTSPSRLMTSFSGSLFSVLEANSAAGARLTFSVNGVDQRGLVTQELTAWSSNCCAPNAVITPAGFTVFVPVEPGTYVLKLMVRVQIANSNDPLFRAGISYNNQIGTFSVAVFGQ